MNNNQLYPVTLNFSTLKGYVLHSIVDVAKKPNLPLFDTRLENEFFIKVANEVYLPLLTILDSTDTNATIIITGHFLELCEKHSPKLLKKLKQLVRTKRLHIVANAYYGNSLMSLYHSDWWATSLTKTANLVESLLNTKIHGIHINQLFRTLELERVTHLSTKFLIRHNILKYNYFDLPLSDLRKFNNRTVSWINEENDCNCRFFYVPNNLYFDTDDLFFSPNLAAAAKSMALKAGSAGSRLSIRRRTPWAPLPFKQNPRLNEKYSLSLYTPQEKAIIRMWEYGAYVISTVYHNQNDKKTTKLFDTFGKLQDAEYLRFLKKNTYDVPDMVIFSSPFEAFVHMQTMIKHLEISLRE